MQDWIFVPGYCSGVRPFGSFSTKQFRTFNAWISNSDLSHNVGMVTTFPLDNNKLVNVVGDQGLRASGQTDRLRSSRRCSGTFITAYPESDEEAVLLTEAPQEATTGLC